MKEKLLGQIPKAFFALIFLVLAIILFSTGSGTLAALGIVSAIIGIVTVQRILIELFE